MLSNLQSHIEKEEIRWNQKLEKKDIEITTLKTEHNALYESANSQVSFFSLTLFGFGDFADISRLRFTCIIGPRHKTLIMKFGIFHRCRLR